ncbi:MAG: DegT/DnrJ/EryC1/StrS family aminotransferase [Candidatus Lindowbacteria bacterium]|nr:DegT/DnrJ/EryC1/StrS family aminotransferase [Candidatus Lindowbacteria bacterium]
MSLVPYIDLKRQHEELKVEILAAVESVVSRGAFILGEEVLELEQWFANFSDCQFGIGVSSGTAALSLSLQEAGVAEDDEVITVPNTFVATVSAIEACRARAILVDVLNDHTMDPQALELAITPETKAVIPVHLYGKACHMREISEICIKNNLAIIEDAAQAVGAKFDDKPVGSFGIGCFSLHPIKTLGACGDGGIIVTNSEKSSEKLKLARNLGLKDRDTCLRFSENNRLDNLQAAIVLVKVKHLSNWILKRREIAKTYNHALEGVVNIPVVHSDDYHTYSTYVITCRDEERDKLMEFLRERHVETKVHYPIPVHLQPAASHLGYQKGDFPVTEWFTESMLSLPSFPQLTKDEQQTVIDTILEFYGVS